MNKFILLTACITPLFLMNVNAAYQGAEISDHKAEISGHKLDKYLSVKCNLPKISDEQVKNVTQKSIACIKDIQQKVGLGDNITESMQRYCTEQKESVFGKAIEFAQDLVLVAKMYGDFNNVTALEKITKNAVRLYNLEGDNFKAIKNNSTDTPEYKKNEEDFRRFIDHDLPRILDIASKYSNVSDGQNINPVTENATTDNIENSTIPTFEYNDAPRIGENENNDHITEFTPVPATQPESRVMAGEPIGPIVESAPFDMPKNVEKPVNPIEPSPFERPSDIESSVNSDESHFKPEEIREPIAPMIPPFEHNDAPRIGENENNDHITEFTPVPATQPEGRVMTGEPIGPIVESAPFGRPDEAREPIEEHPFDMPKDIEKPVNSIESSPFDKYEEARGPIAPEEPAFDRIDEAKEPIEEHPFGADKKEIDAVDNTTESGLSDAKIEQKEEVNEAPLPVDTESAPIEASGNEGKVDEHLDNPNTEDNIIPPSEQKAESTEVSEETDKNAVEGNSSETNESLPEISLEPQETDSEKTNTSSEEVDSSLPHSSWGI